MSLLPQRVHLADERHGDLLEQILQILEGGLVGQQDGGDPPPVPLPQRADRLPVAAHGVRDERISHRGVRNGVRGNRQTRSPVRQM